MQQGNSVCGFFGAVCRACAPNEGCVSGQCRSVIFVDAGPTTNVGGPCVQDSNCGSDGLSFCIPEISAGEPTGFAGGYCSRMCDSTACPPEARCVEAQAQGGGTVNLCLASCTTAMNCRMGYQCDTSSGGVCLP